MTGTHEWVDGFRGHAILILGDLMLDKYIFGQAVGISPEAPVPVVRLERVTYCLGGAANVAANVKSLGGESCLAGVVGDDFEGVTLRKGMRDSNLSSDGVFVAPGRPTTLKARVVANHQQVARVDRETSAAVQEAVRDQLFSYVRETLAGVGAVVVSDYGKGVAESGLLTRLLLETRIKNKTVIVDPKGSDLKKYRNVEILMPNRSATRDLTGIAVIDDTAAERAGRFLLGQTGGQAILLTRGPDGMSLVTEDGGVKHLPTNARRVFDVTGASDTVAAVLALGLSSGRNLSEAACLANHAAGIAVGKMGTQVVSAQELRTALAKTEGHPADG